MLVFDGIASVGRYRNDRRTPTQLDMLMSESGCQEVDIDMSINTPPTFLTNIDTRTLTCQSTCPDLV